MSLAIAVDAMSGASPGDVVRGAVTAAKAHPEVRFVLVGREDSLREEIERAGGSAANVELVGAERVIEAGEPPVEAIRKRTGSSVEVAARLLRSGEVSAFVSAGGTGACVAAATILLGLVPGVRRAALAVSLPAGTGSVVIVDAGANLASRAEHLIQYGIMGSLYARSVLGRDAPRVGLLAFGGEPEEADPVLEGARSAFRGSRLNFVGDVDGTDVFRGASDVVVCDGFVGRIAVGVSESLAEDLSAFAEGELRERLDAARRGGGALLGVNGVVVLARGRPGAEAVQVAVRTARVLVETDLTKRIADEIHSSSEWA